MDEYTILTEIVIRYSTGVVTDVEVCEFKFFLMLMKKILVENVRCKPCSLLLYRLAATE